MSRQLYHLVSYLLALLYLTLRLSTVEGVLNEDAHLVSWSSDSQGDQFFNTDENNFYLAVDADNNIVALPGDESDEVCRYCYY